MRAIQHFRNRLSLELLEPRINLASTSITYTDADGDLVRIKATLPGSAVAPLDDGDLVFLLGGGQLTRLSLTDSLFNGAKIAFSVTRKPGGDGLADIGFIDATGVDLDRVLVKGDLGKIKAGDTTTLNDPGLNLLKVQSMGVRGLATQGGTGDLESSIVGDLGALKVARDFSNASLQVGSPNGVKVRSVSIGGSLIGGGAINSAQVEVLGAIDSLKIGGSVIGGTGNSSGFVHATQSIGMVRIRGSVTGGAGSASGKVLCFGTLGDVVIGGAVSGGEGNASGQISSAAMGGLKIGGSLIGGSGSSSGRVEAFSGSMGTITIRGDVTGSVSAHQAMGAVKVGGSLRGDQANASGVIASGDAMGAVRVRRDIIGASITGTASRIAGGSILAGRIAGVTVGGSLIAGTDGSTGSLAFCGAIVALESLGAVTIKGSIVGNSTNPAIIASKGQTVKPTSGFDDAIARVNVRRNVRFAQILAGVEPGGLFSIVLIPANADASIGSITVGGDWEASSVAAGVLDLGGPGFGTGDELQTVGDTPLVARIASIQIRGAVTGSDQSGDHFGFVAQEVAKVKIGSQSLFLNAGPSNDNSLMPLTNDVRVLEVQ